MREILLVFIAVIYLFMFTACNNVNTNVQKPNATTNSYSIKENISEQSSSKNNFDIEQEDNISNQNSKVQSTSSVDKPSLSTGARQYKYKFDNERFSNIEEFIKWIKETDPVSYKDGQFKTMLEPIREDGYIYVPYYKNKNFKFTKSNDYLVSTRFEMDYEGHGYIYEYRDDKGALLTVTLYYLEKAEAKDAKNNLWNYLNGVGAKGVYEKTWEERQKQGHIKKKNDTIDEDVITFGQNDNGKYANSFLYKNELIVKIVSHEGNTLTFDDFVKNLKFEKVKLD